MTATAEIEELYNQRGKRARELHDSGKKIIGYFCCFVPDEIITAFDLVPYRMFGEMKEPITKADSYLPTVVCPFLRSLLDLGLKGKYSFLRHKSIF
jgi:benzoyl-CoA reductase/2-hydroxyglutaryl-CoA dehydratase subunit BcrC/BadD/HgdB